jgi:hypothetical protein
MRTKGVELFNYSKCSGQIAGHLTAWQAISRYVEDSAALNMHARAQAEANGESVLFSSIDDHAASIARDVCVGLEVYNRQMIVVGASLFERFTKHLILELFLAYPNRISKFIENDKRKPVVNWNLVLEATSKEEIMRQLAQEAASKAVRGTVDKVIKRLKELGNYEGSFPKDLEKRLPALIERRHEIVHKKYPLECTTRDVMELFTAVSEYTAVLLAIAEHENLEVMKDGRCLLWADEEFYEQEDLDGLKNAEEKSTDE